MKEILKAYFEELIKTDSAIKAVYEESKLDECSKYIKSQAQKQATNGFCAVEDAVVYKWARDFMLGDIAEKSKTEKKKVPDSKNWQDEEDEEPEIITEEKTVIKTKQPDFEKFTQILFDF